MASGKILIVDDDRNLLEVLKVRVESAGYDVFATVREQDALDAARNEAFDLSIVDLQLERSSGIVLMKELRLLLPDMPVIILTGHGSETAAREGMEYGAFDYLVKPCDLSELVVRIRQACAKGV